MSFAKFIVVSNIPYVIVEYFIAFKTRNTCYHYILSCVVSVLVLCPCAASLLIFVSNFQPRVLLFRERGTLLGMYLCRQFFVLVLVLYLP